MRTHLVSFAIGAFLFIIIGSKHQCNGDTSTDLAQDTTGEISDRLGHVNSHKINVIYFQY